jgi:uncharacterized protein YdhG (YjbR/CyaY superfamily)
VVQEAARARTRSFEGRDMAKTKDDPAAVNEYLAGLPADKRDALEELRQLIHASVPDLRERISYGTSVIFALKGDLVGFVSQPKHLSFLTMSPDLASAMKAEIERTHRLSGATIHFSPENPLPRALVEKIVLARVKEQEVRSR